MGQSLVMRGLAKAWQQKSWLVALWALGCNASSSTLPADDGSANTTVGQGGTGQGGTGQVPSTTGQAATTVAPSTTESNVSSTSAATSVGGTASTTTGATTPSRLPGEPIAFVDGWAALDGNSVGIQGAFYAFSDAEDGGDSVIQPSDFESSGRQVCVDGSAGMVVDMDFAAYWGAAIGFNLMQDEGAATANAYDAAAAGVTGFAFYIEGSDPLPAGGELRFNIKVSGDTNNYCRRVAQAGANQFLLSDMLQSCWENDATAPAPDSERLEALHWQYVTNSTSSYSFALCITELSALTE